jgi:vacuolar-type H+-ATPase subunit E/Vma4
MRNILLIFLAGLILGACSAGKTSTGGDLASAPEWVRKTPTEPGFYLGIGSAPKTTQMDYREKARQNALSEMAANISVEISATSVLSQYETDRKVSDYYRDNIKTSTKNYLEGYEMVDSWENRDRYWVYYRLARSEYERIKNGRIQTALSKSESEYRQAAEQLNTGNYADGIKSLVKSLEMISDVMGEDLRSDLTGMSNSYSSALTAKLSDLLRDIKIIFPKGPVSVMKGQYIDNDNIEANIETSAGLRLQGIPVITSYSYAPGKKTEGESDISGLLRIKPGMVNAGKGRENITCVVNVEKLIRQATSNPFIIKLLARIKVPEYNLPMNISAARFRVIVKEPNDAEKDECAALLKEITSKLVADGYAIVPDSSGDYIVIQVNPSTKLQSQTSNRAAISVSGNFIVTNRIGEVLFQQQFNDLTGLGNSLEEARKDAFQTLSNKIRISILPAMYQHIFPG